MRYNLSVNYSKALSCSAAAKESAKLLHTVVNVSDVRLCKAEGAEDMQCILQTMEGIMTTLKPVNSRNISSNLINLTLQSGLPLGGGSFQPGACGIWHLGSVNSYFGKCSSEQHSSSLRKVIYLIFIFFLNLPSF